MRSIALATLALCGILVLSAARPVRADVVGVPSPCGPGQTPDAAGNCVPAPTPVPCPAGQVANAAGQCETPPGCPPGTVAGRDGTCVPPCQQGRVSNGLDGCANQPPPCSQVQANGKKRKCGPARSGSLINGQRHV